MEPEQRPEAKPADPVHHYRQDEPGEVLGTALGHPKPASQPNPRPGGRLDHLDEPVQLPPAKLVPQVAPEEYKGRLSEGWPRLTSVYGERLQPGL